MSPQADSQPQLGFKGVPPPPVGCLEPPLCFPRFCRTRRCGSAQPQGMARWVDQEQSLVSLVILRHTKNARRTGWAHQNYHTLFIYIYILKKPHEEFMNSFQGQFYCTCFHLGCPASAALALMAQEARYLGVGGFLFPSPKDSFQRCFSTWYPLVN